MKAFYESVSGKIFHGDNVEILPNLPQADLIVTSPPYGSLRKYKGFSWDLDLFMQKAFDALKDGGVMVWVVGDQVINGDKQLLPFIHAQSAKEAGFNLYDVMIWEKPSPACPTEGRYYDVFEYMLVFCKGRKPKTLNLICDRQNKSAGTVSNKETRSSREDRKTDGRKRTVKEKSRRFNVWQISRGHNKTKHPAVFPFELAKDHILSWSNEGDLVLDPFGGSGTTALASIATKRAYISIDISEEYCEMQKQRIEEVDLNFCLTMSD